MKFSNKNIVLALGIIVVVLITGVLMVSRPGEEKVNLTDKKKEMDIMVTEDGTKYLIHPDKLKKGIPTLNPKDAIPSIDDPTFESVESADPLIEDNELVLGLVYKGEERAYPLQILVWHEIVNDFLAEYPVLITYCPLCGSGIAFNRTIDGEVVEFGVSGQLYNSNLVMYDRKTQSYWTQIGGRAVVGKLTGKELERIPISTVTWEKWKKEHPNSKVLSRPAGFNKPYGDDPYGNYYNDSFLFFPVGNRNDTIHPKTRIIGVEINNTFKAYKESDVKENKTVEDTVNGVRIKMTKNQDGSVSVIRKDNDKEIVHDETFWFAWYAFHPKTKLYEA